jgi:hypothetical protein
VQAFWLGRGSGELSAQALLPDGVFVRDSGGTVWLSHDCDGQMQCAFVWKVTPTKAGRYELRARGEDEAGNRSGWVKIDFRVQDGPATPTPMPAAKPSGSPTP